MPSFSSSRPSSSFSSSKSSFSSSKSSFSSSKSSSSSFKSSTKSSSSKTQTKTETKVKTETKATKPVQSTPTHITNNYQQSSGFDWMPFFFLWEVFDDVSETEEVVIVEDGKVVEQPQDDGFTGFDFLSIVLTIAVLATFIWSIVRMRRM